MVEQKSPGAENTGETTNQGLSRASGLLQWTAGSIPEGMIVVCNGRVYRIRDGEAPEEIDA